MATYHFGLLFSTTDKEGKLKKKEELVSKKNGTFPVYLSVTQNRKLARYKTSVELDSVRHWNPNAQQVRQSHPNYQNLNNDLKNLKAKAEEAERKVVESGAEVTSKAIVNVLRKLETNTFEKTFSFFDYAEGRMKALYDTGKYKNFQKYDALVKRLRCFVNNVKAENVIIRNQKDWKNQLKGFSEDLLFTDITLQFLNKFDTYLHLCPNNCRKGLRLNQNTIRKQMEIFRTLYLKGVNELEEEGLKIERNPFNKYECKGIEPKEREKLSFDEIEAIKSLELEKDSSLWHTRNCFLFAFYCGGVRCSDVLQIRECYISKEGDEYRLRYTMDKTTKKKNIALVSEAIEILKNYYDLENPSTNYIFPFLNNSASFAKAVTDEEKDALVADEIKVLKQTIGAKNALLNKNLKKLAEMANIKKNVSMHIARHSFADLARKNTGDVYDIKSILGHSSISTTQNYLKKLDTETQDKALRNVFHKEDESEKLLTQLKKLDAETLKALLNKLNV